MIQEFKRLLAQFGIEYFGRMYSIYRGEVANNEDPEFRGRVKVKCRAAYGDDVYHYWALPMGIASGSPALWMIPNVGDAIWVQFEGGDPRYPVYSHGWFLDNKAPQSAKVNGNKIDATVLQSKSGHRIVMNDKGKTVTISNASGLKIVLTDKKINIVGEAQKAVRGDDLKKLLDTLLDVLKTSKDITGKPFAADTIVLLETLKLQTTTILSSKVTLDNV